MFSLWLRVSTRRGEEQDLGGLQSREGIRREITVKRIASNPIWGEVKGVVNPYDWLCAGE